MAKGKVKKAKAISPVRSRSKSRPKTKLKSKKKTPRAPSSMQVRRYEGASKAKRLSRWFAPPTSANNEISLGLFTLRNRSRDLRRNNPYAAKGIQVITSNVVGHGIQTQFRGNNSEAIETEWSNWAESTAIDFDGRNNIYGLQRLVMDAVAESGEVLVRKRYTALLNVPLQYQVLEADFLDVNMNDDLDNGGSIIQGIEFDDQGKRVAYYLLSDHPGSYNGYDSSGITYSTSDADSERVPAEDVYHIFRMDRPGQARGIPWLAPVIVTLKDFDDYADAQLMRQKVAACFTAFVRDITADFSERDDNTTDDNLGARLEPAIIEHLPPGKTIEFTKPPEVQGYGEYTSAVLRSIAAGLGITYESLTGDLSQVNFSSARLGWLEMGRNLQAWREHIMIAHMLDPIAQDFLRVMEIKGATIDGLNYIHVPPKREMFDPTKETGAVIEAIRGGISTLSDELMAQGKDPEDHLKQYKADMDMLDKYGLKLKCDPRTADTVSEKIAPDNPGGDTVDNSENIRETILQ